MSAIVERSSNTIEHLLNSQIKPTIKLIPLACFGTTVKKKSDRLSPPERRSQLIEATLICLMREGARGLSSRKICAQAQVSVGLLNHHFSSQEQLVAAAYEESSRRPISPPDKCCRVFVLPFLDSHYRCHHLSLSSVELFGPFGRSWPSGITMLCIHIYVSMYICNICPLYMQYIRVC